MRWPFTESVLFEEQGLYSTVKITKKGNRVNLFTGGKYLQSSFDLNSNPKGTVFDWYLAAPWFSGNFSGQIGTILILGLGAGSQVKLFNQAYQVESIIGVEIDPLVISLGRQFFDLNDRNLQVVTADASDYIKNAAVSADLIILDAYRENKYDPELGQNDLLKQTAAKLSQSGVLIINRVNGEKSNQDLENDLRGISKVVFAMKVYNNIFYICTNSEVAPKSVSEAAGILKQAEKTNRTLKFFDSLKLSNLRVAVPLQIFTW
ncbi:MAG: hypothetical protein NT141_03580 [candidate division WWE3 bacterium]|nr:hypothetical protein [candidate division WWE3 bacterium]